MLNPRLGARVGGYSFHSIGLSPNIHCQLAWRTTVSFRSHIPGTTAELPSSPPTPARPHLPKFHDRLNGIYCKCQLRSPVRLKECRALGKTIAPPAGSRVCVRFGRLECDPERSRTRPIRPYGRTGKTTSLAMRFVRLVDQDSESPRTAPRLRGRETPRVPSLSGQSRRTPQGSPPDTPPPRICG